MKRDRQTGTRRSPDSQRSMRCFSLVQRDLNAPTRHAQDTLHPGEGNAALVISQFSYNLPVSLNNTNTAKNLELTQVEHACSPVVPDNRAARAPDVRKSHDAHSARSTATITIIFLVVRTAASERGDRERKISKARPSAHHFVHKNMNVINLSLSSFSQGIGIAITY